MALTADERRLIATANMHLPGRQLDPSRSSATCGGWPVGARAAARRAAASRGAGRATGQSAPRPTVRARLSATGAFDLKHRSRALTEGPERAAARAYLHGIGYAAEDLAKPIVGVAHSWIETMPCNFNNRVLAAKVKEGIRAAGGTPMELNTIAISDGITMGTAGHARLAGLPRADRRLDRAGRSTRTMFDARRRDLAAATRRSPAP